MDVHGGHTGRGKIDGDLVSIIQGKDVAAILGLPHPSNRRRKLPTIDQTVDRIAARTSAAIEAEVTRRAQATRRVMPVQKPGKSIQTYATPPEYIAAVKKRFGIREFAYDLAASKENTKARHFFCEEEDSLAQVWSRLDGDLWLNPPYAHIAPWAQKCNDATWARWPTMASARRIFFLVPAGVGANWFASFVHNRALVLFNNGRISFDGIAPYPKDTLLAVYGLKPGYEVWDWRKQK
jgi:phage N-6-adenine-methyltransferase